MKVLNLCFEVLLLEMFILALKEDTNNLEDNRCNGPCLYRQHGFLGVKLGESRGNLPFTILLDKLSREAAEAGAGYCEFYLLYVGP